MKKRTEGHTETTISADTRADWSDAFAPVPSLRDRLRLAHQSRYARGAGWPPAHRLPGAVRGASRKLGQLGHERVVLPTPIDDAFVFGRCLKPSLAFSIGHYPACAQT